MSIRPRGLAMALLVGMASFGLGAFARHGPMGAEVNEPQPSDGSKGSNSVGNRPNGGHGRGNNARIRRAAKRRRKQRARAAK